MEINGHNRLIRVDASNAGLSGQLPSDPAGVFTGAYYLWELILDDNNFTGAVPETPFIVTGSFNLPGLLSLSIRNNQLTEVTHLADEALVVIDLSHNQIEGSLPSIASEQFWTARFNDNRFSSFEHVQSDLWSWESGAEPYMLDLSNNAFSGTFPRVSDGFLLFQRVSLRNNDIRGNTDDIFYNFENLWVDYVDLADNMLDIYGSEAPGSLSYLNMSNNKITSIDKSLSGKYINFDHNPLDSFPSEWDDDAVAINVFSAKNISFGTFVTLEDKEIELTIPLNMRTYLGHEHYNQRTKITIDTMYEKSVLVLESEDEFRGLDQLACPLPQTETGQFLAVSCRTEWAEVIDIFILVVSILGLPALALALVFVIYKKCCEKKKEEEEEEKEKEKSTFEKLIMAIKAIKSWVTVTSDVSTDYLFYYAIYQYWYEESIFRCRDINSNFVPLEYDIQLDTDTTFELRLSTPEILTNVGHTYLQDHVFYLMEMEYESPNTYAFNEAAIKDYIDRVNGTDLYDVYGFRGICEVNWQCSFDDQEYWCYGNGAPNPHQDFYDFCLIAAAVLVGKELIKLLIGLYRCCDVGKMSNAERSVFKTSPFSLPFAFLCSKTFKQNFLLHEDGMLGAGLHVLFEVICEDAPAFLIGIYFTQVVSNTGLAYMQIISLSVTAVNTTITILTGLNKIRLGLCPSKDDDDAKEDIEMA